jgi:hypothetical protein
MKITKRSLGEWLSNVFVGIVLSAFWLLKTIPFTTLLILPSGIFSLIGYNEEINLSSDWLSWFTIAMLIDGYLGHQNAERKEQQMMQNFYRWHGEEMMKNDQKE